MQITDKCFKPFPWCLFETIDDLFEKINMMWVVGALKTRWLGHVDRSGEGSM